MLRGIRKASSNWVGKSIMFAVVGFLVISFAIWGIGDMFRGFGLSTVAKIGGTEISVDQFRQIYNERLQQIGRQLGRPITPEQAAALGLDNQILGQLVAETVLDERVNQLGLRASDQDVAQSIRRDPNFLGPSGQFDHGRFESIIRQAGYTESRYIAEQRRVQLRRQLASTVAGAGVIPEAQLQALHRYQNEQRSAEYIHLNAADAGEIGEPTPEVLASYFEERKALFRAPEYRKLTVIALVPAEQAQWIQISDDEARKSYEQRRTRYTTPERRHLMQIVFPNAEEARAAWERIKAGTSFADVATERGLKPSDIDLGTVTKAGIVDRAVADAAFALKQGEVSEPVQGRFGTALVRVDSIEPEHVQSFEEAAPGIKRELAMERARTALVGTYDKIEDARAGGISLAEVASKLNLAAIRVDAIDRSGRGADGNPVTGLPDAQRLVSSAFATDIGVENDPLQVEGGYVWYEVQEITPARDRALDEVKDKVAERWRADEIGQRLKAKATDILDKAKTGVPLGEAAGGRPVDTAKDLKRGRAGGGLPVKVVDAVFRTAQGGVAISEGDSPIDQYVFKVTDVGVPALNSGSEEAKRVEQALRATVSESLLGEYVARLEKDIGASINRNALRQVVTGTSNQNFN